jgi:structure-specific endonuclease subunit SLX1
MYINMFLSYCLIREDSGASYVGATVDMEHRLRQHNGIIKGGAIATTNALKKGHTWEILCNVTGFPTWNAALQFEWRWKHISRKLHGSPMAKRISALIDLVNMDKSTSKAEPYSSYEPLLIKVYKQCPETEQLFKSVLAHAVVELYKPVVL